MEEEEEEKDLERDREEWRRGWERARSTEMGGRLPGLVLVRLSEGEDDGVRTFWVGVGGEVGMEVRGKTGKDREGTDEEVKKEEEW